MFDPEQVGALRCPSSRLAVLLLIEPDDLTYGLVGARATWLGADEIGGKGVIRLHREPIAWLEAGCRGVVHMPLMSRRALRELRSADQIVCNDMHTAMEAWDWGFGATDAALGRFEINAEPDDIADYVRTQATYQASATLRALGRAA